MPGSISGAGHGPTNGRYAAPGREDGYGAALPVSVHAGPRARVRLLEAIDGGERHFITTAVGGALSIRTELVRSNVAVMDYGSLSVDWCNGTVASQMGCVTLSRTELRLLAALMERQGSIVDSEQLLRSTWPAEANTELPLLHVYLDSLRHRLAAIGAASHLRAVLRDGYMFTP
jgi:DNA-binding response OmpR family regulator